jgi:hypothetical protein
VLNSIGWIELCRRNFERAVALFQESRERLEEQGHKWSIAFSITSLGRTAFYSGDYDQGLSLGEEALRLFRQVGDGNRIADTLALTALGELWGGGHADRRNASKRLVETLKMSRDIGHRVGITRTLPGFAEMALIEGQLERATRILGASDAIHRVTEAFERYQFERCTDETKGRMDYQAWQTAWREGRTMTMAQVIACSLKSG